MSSRTLTSSHRDLLRDHGTKLGRFLIGLLFVASGLTMLLIQSPVATATYFTTLGIPAAGVVVWLVIAVKVVAGLLIIIGRQVVIASLALIGFVVLATFIAHSNFSDPMQVTATLKNFAIIGGLLYLVAYGPGGMNIKMVTVPDKS